LFIDEKEKDRGSTGCGIRGSISMGFSNLITPSSNLTEEQRRYASHPWTHLDFLVYDTVTHKAKLAIEVDGT
jgi:hypothetical protein